MILINTSTASTPVRVLTVAGDVDYIHIAGRGKVKLTEGLTPDPAWLSTLSHIRVNRITQDTQEPKPKQHVQPQHPRVEQKADPKPQGAKE